MLKRKEPRKELGNPFVAQQQTLRNDFDGESSKRLRTKEEEPKTPVREIQTGSISVGERHKK